ncbi:DoxX family protein [Streptomyces alfalfae]|uniref:DoxX family protein n=1 Tax=Streptomyces alfalfae TaxID=1642299 RepID=A0A7T4PGR7_9ACTN|nr:DoxX family protein [Streptomyces alfalfae]QQC89916.1 DoxX family protein [Streptomyces alfalfae]
MDSIWLTGGERLAVLRVGLGLRLERWRHEDGKGRFERGAGVEWASDVAARHRWSVVRGGFDTGVAPRPGTMAYVGVHAGLALGLGLGLGLDLALIAGFLTTVALAVGLLLDVILAGSRQPWSRDHALGLS